MLGKRGASLLSAGLICAIAGIYLVAAEKSTPAQRREQFTKAHRDGNYKVAYEGLRRLALDPGNDPARVGDEVKVNRRYYRLERIKDAKIKVSGGRGQAADQKVEKYKRIELKNLEKVKSGDLLEVELEIDSKNDYEYLLFEDPKAAGCETMLVRSGYNSNDLGAYMELRDDRVCFFVRTLARGKHSVAYRLRAEIPGRFSALPARASAMYAPELKGNSDEIKFVILD